MAVELIVERSLTFEADLKRNFRPFEVVEGNFSYRVLNAQTQRVTVQQRRQRKVRYVGTDQNSIRETIEDLGPATAEGMFVMPCVGEVEMAQAWELIDWQKQQVAERAKRSALVKPERDKAFRSFLAEELQEDFYRARHITTSGPALTVQRS